MAKRQYTTDERAEALAALDANGGDVSHTARQLGIPRATIQGWAKLLPPADPAPPPVPFGTVRQEKRQSLAEALEEVARKLLGDMGDEEKRRSASLRDIATAFGIAVDKRQILTGQPTAINATALTDEQRVARIEAIIDRVRVRAGAGGPVHPRGSGGVGAVGSN